MSTMFPIKKMLLLVCFLFMAAKNSTYAQYYTKQNKVWIFGRIGGVDFSSGTPVAISSDLYTDEGCASLADTDGHLMFYTQGDSVWNKNNERMPNGRGIAPFSCNSTTQAAVMVPVIGSPNRYYVFSLEHILSTGKLAYSIVNMTLDGGLGDVETATRGTLIDSGFTEKMVAVRGNCCIWLIVHKVDAPKFYAYKITNTGINMTPVISSSGVSDDYEGYGVIKVSPDRTKLALTHFDLGSTDTSRVELFDINVATGVVSNCRVLNTYSTPYGTDFSPNSSKLYVHHWTYGKLLQYEVSLPTTAGIIASEYVVASSLNVGSDIKLGPDDKVYFSYDHGYLNSVNAPNLTGSACNYVASSVNLSPGLCMLGLPPVYWADTTCPSTDISAMPAHNNISIYPNPASELVTIELPGAGTYDVQVLDVVGRVRLSAKGLGSSHIDLDIADLPPGNYFVVANQDGILYRVRFTVTGIKR